MISSAVITVWGILTVTILIMHDGKDSIPTGSAETIHAQEKIAFPYIKSTTPITSVCYTITYVRKLKSSTFCISSSGLFPIRINLNYESYIQSAGLLWWVINPIARPLPTQDNTNTEETRIHIHASSWGFEPMILVFERAKTYTSDHAAIVTGRSRITKYDAQKLGNDCNLQAMFQLSWHSLQSLSLHETKAVP
jgi:hypothetical protein